MDELIGKLKQNKILIEILENDKIKLEIPEDVEAENIIDEVRKNKQNLIEYLNKVRKRQTTKEIQPCKKEICEVLPDQSWRYIRYKSGVMNPNNFSFTQEMKNVNLTALNEAVNIMISRHEILRTVFFYNKGQVWQKICAKDDFKSKVFFDDISGEKNIKVRLKSIIKETSNSLFDFEKEPAFRCKLIKYGKDKFILIFTIDHMIRDLESIEIIKKELKLLYHACNKGLPCPLEEPKFQFKDYVIYHNQNYKGKKLKYHQAYFERLFKDMPSKLQMKAKYSRSLQMEDDLDFQKPDKAGFSNKSKTLALQRDTEILDFEVGKVSQAGGYGFSIPKDISIELQKLSLQLKTTLFNIVLTAYCIFLKRIGNQKEFLIDSPISTRNREEFTEIIGWLTGALILRVKVDDNLCVKNLLRHCKEVVQEAMDHLHHHYLNYLEDFKIRSEPINTRLNLVYVDQTDEDRISLEPKHFDVDYTFFDFSFEVIKQKNIMFVNCTYNKEFLSESKISEVCNVFINVLKVVIQSLNH